MILKMSLSIKNIKKLISLDNFRQTLVYALIVTNTFYFADIDYSILTKGDFESVFKQYVLLKFIGVGVLIHLVFYRFLIFGLRLIFHGFAQGRLIQLKKKFIKNKSFSQLRESYFALEQAKTLVSKILIRLGYISKEELIKQRIPFIDFIKKEILNEGLLDLYKWMCVILHLLFTLIFVWAYLKWWMILVAIVLLGFISLIAIGLIQIVLNVNIVEKAIEKLERDFLLKGE